MSQKLQYIEITKIYQHPDNPRKDLGDLSELAESIKKNGVMQNLTVVKRYGEITGEWAGSYTVIIGHRRLAASKLAGLKTVPCVVAELTLDQQIATMLLENMQRSDLTPYEEAQGFQMMFNMGETVKTCAEKTGFSESTVRRRVKLLDLDQDKFKKAEKRGGSITDYMELEKIEDIDLKNEVLDSIGTKNFQNKLQQALETEKHRAIIKERTTVIATYATQIESVDHETMEYVSSSYVWDKEFDIKRPDDADTVKYYYTVGGSSISLYREKQPETEEEARERERKDARTAERDRIERELETATKRAYNCRIKFISDFKVKKEHLSSILIFATNTLLDTAGHYGNYIDGEMFAELLHIPIVQDDYDEESLSEAIARSPEYAMLIATYCTRENLQERYYRSNWDIEKREFVISYTENENLSNLYNFLLSLGYEMSDEEKALEDGTHELFKQAKDLEQEGD